MSKRTIIADELSQPVAEFSHAAVCGDLIIVGAKGATAKAGPVPLGGNLDEAFDRQVDLVYRNVEHVLDKLSTSKDNVLQVTAFVTDWRVQEGIAASLAKYFGQPAPAISYIYSPSFAVPELLFEVDFVATKHGSREVLELHGVTSATYANGWLFSAGMTSHESSASLQDDLLSISEQIEGVLSQAGLGKENLVRMRCELVDARDVGVVEGWWRAFLQPRPVLVIALTGASVLRGRITADFVASSERPELVAAQVSSRKSVKGAESPTVACTKGVAFTSAVGAVPGAKTKDVNQLGDKLSEALGPLAMSLADVVKVEGVIRDWRCYRQFRSEYARVFEFPYPARSLTQGQPKETGQDLQLSCVCAQNSSTEIAILIPG